MKSGLRSTMPRPAQRVFVGKTADRAATLVLSDAQGHKRLALTVDPAGNASIEFLDAEGKVVQRFAPTPAPVR